MDTAVRAPGENAVNGIAQSTAITNDCRFEFLFAVVADGERRGCFYLQAQADPETAPRFVFKLKRLQVAVERVSDLFQNDGLRVFNLLLREERLALAFMTAVGAVTRSRPLDARTGTDFEIS